MSSHAGWLWVNGEWLESEISLDDDQVEFAALGSSLGTWPRSEVLISGGADGRFTVEVDGESLPFSPHSALPFAAAIKQSTVPNRARHAAPSDGWWSHQTRGGKVAVSTVALIVVAGVGNAALSKTPPELPLVAAPAVSTTAPIATTTSTTKATTTTVPDTRVLALVVSVTDGDTIRVLMPDGTNEPVRLIGIDAPEKGQLHAAESKTFLEQLIMGKEVELVTDVSDRDFYDRLLRYVYVGEVNVNEAMVLSGLAIAKEYAPDTSMASVLAAAQSTAQAQQLGGWASTAANSTTAPTTPPASNCHPSYTGACVPNDGRDVDCDGGEGDGPHYVKGPVRVVGTDVFGLDGNGDGVGCE